MARKQTFLLLATLIISLGLITGDVHLGVVAQGATQVGIPPAGQNALELIGQIDQDGTNFTTYGYVTYLYGLPDDLLFADSKARSETTARITFYATATANAGGHAVVGNIIVHDSSGTVTFYFNNVPAGSFKDPKSFASGAPILTATIRSQDILNAQSQTQGVVNGISEFTQTTVASFTLQNLEFQLGNVGLIERLTYVGQASRPSVAPRGTIVIAGYAVVTGSAQ